MKVWLVIICLFSAVNVTANTVGESRWQFDVLLDDKKIGYHDFLVKEQGGQQVIQTNARFDIKILFIKVFSYRHENEERWQGNCLRAINATTDSNGDDFVVRGEATSDGFSVKTLSDQQDLPACLMTFAYWNPDFLQEKRLLNSQTGEYEAVTITQQGQEDVLINDKAVKAVKYLIDVEAGPITLWYAADDRQWLALESVVEGGKTLRYQPVVIPAT
ncbi:DUF6134 family protein [uncultured Paraglaciecola sp.]|uniref:DUF6134 family protein n=1 Tax=uncultured Paraglaciecola sp. TaxID=1765024 RepID=UPI0026194C2F|nr:DUF6134 family protein [uncultured Paraglaciecola sp.]